MANQARQLLEQLRAQRSGMESDVPVVSASGEVAPPPGPSLARRMLETARGQQPAGSTQQAVAAGAGERLIGNLTGLPQGLLNMANPAANRARGLLGQPERPPPQLPIPSGREVASGIETAGLLGRSMLPGGDEFPGIPEAFQQRQEARGQMQQDRPGAFGTGEFLGDVGTLAAGRAPAVRAPGGVFDRPIREGLEKAATAINPTQMTTGGRRAVERVLRSDNFQNLARAGGRASETGLEGALLAMAQEGNPVETAAFAAGGQLVSSGALTVAKEASGIFGASSVKGKAASLVASGLVMGGLVTMLREVGPGNENRILDSFETGFGGVASKILLGAAVGLAGRRTKVDGLMSQFPRIADAMQTLPRTGIIKLSQALASDPELESTVSAMTNNPAAFTRSEIDRYMDSLSQDDPAAALRKLLEDENFRTKVSAPHPRLIGTPVREED